VTVRKLSEHLGKADERYIQDAMNDLDYLEAPVREQKKRTNVRHRNFILIAAAVSAVFALGATAFAGDWFGLRNMILPDKQVITPPDDPADDSTPPQKGDGVEVDAISLAGYNDSPEAKATAEWQAYLQECRDAGMMDDLGNDIYSGGQQYLHYQVYNDEMAAKLDEITAKYGLKLHNELFLLDERELVSVVGDFLGENRAATPYIFDDGTFKFDGSLTIDGYGLLDYQFQRCVKGSFTDILLIIGNAGEYAEWNYTAKDGTELLMALAPHKALIIADMEDSFVTVNVLAGSDPAEDEIFSSGPITGEELMALADSFDWSVLTPAKPVKQGELPSDDPALDWEQDAQFYNITCVEKSVAQQFMTDFMDAVETGDKRTAAGMLLYPMAVNINGEEYTAMNAEEFLTYYDDIINSSFIETINMTRYDATHFDLIPHNGMIGAGNGAVWYAPMSDGGLYIMSLRSGESASAEHGEAGALGKGYLSYNEAYAAVLDQLVNHDRLPDNSLAEPYGPWDVNTFAVHDVTGDDIPELIIMFRDTYTAGMTGQVIQYNEYSGMMEIILTDYPSLTFYSNGYVKAAASHNQGAAGDALWPYTLYMYDPAAGYCVPIVMVDAWDSKLTDTYNGEKFPADADTSGTGVVYYVMAAGEYDLSEPLDITEYESRISEYLNGAGVIEPEYISISRENIDKLRAGE